MAERFERKPSPKQIMWQDILGSEHFTKKTPTFSENEDCSEIDDSCVLNYVFPVREGGMVEVW